MEEQEIFPGWTPREIAAHYNVPPGLDGTGQRVAVIDLGEIVDPDEIRRDFAKMGGPVPEISIIDDNSAHDPALGQQAIESHIDLEVIGTICPSAHLVLYRCAFSFSGMATAIATAVKDNVDVISISWGAAESQLSSGDIAKIERALQEAKEACITVCAAAGDFGASGLSDPKNRLPMNDPKGRVHCIYPASSPLVLACGGTELIIEQAKKKEVVWNNTAIQGLATGGGVSEQFPKPVWQSEVHVVSANHEQRTGRILPDVAALAAVRDWSFVINGGMTALLGGTSAVAPFFAALVTLANQIRADKGKTRLGFLNDRLYEKAHSDDLFIGIVKGHNKVAPNGVGYEAQTGFDACTGWGVPRAERLLNMLGALP